MRSRVIGFSLLVLFLTFFLSGCVSNTSAMFKANIDNVRVAVDGEDVGHTPTQATLGNALWNDPTVVLTKAGYKSNQVVIKKELKVINLVFGIILWWPSLLYIWGPAPFQYFEMIPE